MMKLGNTGSDVEKWQLFLIGQNLLDKADGDFDSDTERATIAFQASAGLECDGIVGHNTLSAAKDKGFDQSPTLSPPASIRPLGYADKDKIFGPLGFVPDPQPGNPEAIKITNGWTKNLQKVSVPQLIGKTGGPSNGIVLFHSKGADRLSALWSKWEACGLLPLVLSWDGAWAPRFVRGSRTTLSSHAYATAFDINARWNPLGVVPPASGKTGSVRDLVSIASEFDFFWGGWLKRQDGMHFELIG